jgi:hypothetical protein
MIMATKRKPAKPKKRKVSPCTSCKPFKVTPARDSSGRFKKRRKK